MKILALEFSSEQRSVALVENNAGVVSTSGRATERGGRNTQAFGLIEQALAQSGWPREEIGCMAVGLGPGSYTGIRAALALAQGWQLAGNIKTLGLSSVECLAAQAWEGRFFGAVNIIVDAQRQEFYLARYEISSTHFSESEKVHLVSAEEVADRARAGEIIIGPDAQKFGRVLFPDAAMLGQIAATRTTFVSADKLEPIYLRETNFVKATPPLAW